MGLFSAKKQIKAANNSNEFLANDILYNSLFADDIKYYTEMSDHPAISWINKNETITKRALMDIVNDDKAESRIKFLSAYYALKKSVKIDEKIYFGTILEVPVNGKYDILAFYSDLTARYYNHGNNVIVYEGGKSDIDKIIDETNSVSKAVCRVIGPWEDKRLPRPTGDTTRFTYLMSDGLYFGQGPIDEMSKDEMGSAILGSGANLMSQLISLCKK
jgi:hypothetical protein